MAERELPERQESEARRILIVDDMRTIQVLLPVYLVGHFYEFRSVSSGQEALDVLDEFRPDLVISDVNMPDMSGPELCRAIRASSVHADLPVILMSGSIDQAELNAVASESRANAVVSKPIDPERLAATVSEILT